LFRFFVDVHPVVTSSSGGGCGLPSDGLSKVQLHNDWQARTGNAM
jgi:hypothetical protein